jgi:hypothetical protein
MRWLIWSIFGLLVLVWTGLAWGVSRAFQWGAQSLASGAAADWGQLAAVWSVPNWVLNWVDVDFLQSLQVGLVQALEALQTAWPDLGLVLSWLVPVVWAVWVMGVVPMLLLALMLHWLVGRGGPAAPTAAPERAIPSDQR